MDSDFKNRLLDRAENALWSSSGDRGQSEASFLRQLICELGIDAPPPGFSPGALFRAVLNNRCSADKVPALLDVLATPSQRLRGALRRGDWMLRFVPGTGDVGHISILASEDLLTQPMLSYQNVAVDSAQPGFYGLVIEAGAFPHDRREPFARRFLDSHGRAPAHTVILRPQLIELGSSEDTFDPSTVPQNVADAVRSKDWPQALALAIRAGWHDENQLTDFVFFTRHPELPIGTLDSKLPRIMQLRTEWVKIRDYEARPAIEKASADATLNVSGNYVAERDRQFWGESGKKFRDLVEWAAREADINPGLLGAVLLAEVDQSAVYLSSGEVRTFLSGTDDFFEERAQLSANVPAFSKVHFDITKKTTNRNESGRLVTTIPFNSGKDAALATAVYLKNGEIKIRSGAQKNGGDFDKLPIETRLALTRLAMATGHGWIAPDGTLIKAKWEVGKDGIGRCVPLAKGEKGGILCGVASRLERVLKGEDILVRQNEDRRYPDTAHITDRNATILTAQALHLSDWIFGKPQSVASPKVHETMESSEGYDIGIGQRCQCHGRGTFLGFDAIDDASLGEDAPGRVVHVYFDDLAHPIAESKAILQKVVETYARIGITVTVDLGSFTVEKFGERPDKIQVTILSPKLGAEDEKEIRDTLVSLGNRDPRAVQQTMSTLGHASGFSAGFPADPPLTKAVFVKEITPLMRSQLLQSFSLMYSDPAEAARAAEVYFYADTIIHELGHTFGLGHTADTGNYMYDPPAGHHYDRLSYIVSRPEAVALINEPSKWGAWVKAELLRTERSFTPDQVHTMRATLERFIRVAATSAGKHTAKKSDATDSEDSYTIVRPAADRKTDALIGEDDGKRTPISVSPFPPSGFAEPLTNTDQKLKDAFTAAIATVKANAAYDGLPNIDALPIIIVALNDDGTRPFAGNHVKDMYYSGSLLKVAAMYGAFQLRHAVNALATTLDPAKVKDAKAFFQAVHNAFDASILSASDIIRTSSTAGNRVPRYEEIFYPSQDPSGNWSVRFHDDTNPKLDFDGHLKKMVVFSHNPSAGFVIQKLGFSWINGLLQKAGFFRPGSKNGIWLAGDYLNPQTMINAEHAKQIAHDADPTKRAGDPDSLEEFNLGISGWATVDIHSENDNDVKQVATGIDLARLFVLLFDSRLVDNYLGSSMDLSNGDMAGLLQLAVASAGASGIDNAPSLIERVPLTGFSITWSKIGVGDLKVINGGQKIFSEAMLVHQTGGPRRNFVVVWQNVKLPSNLDPLARIRDIIQNTINAYQP